MFNDLEKHSFFVYNCMSSKFYWHNAFLWITLPVQKFELHFIGYTVSSARKSFKSIASFNFNRPPINFSVKDSLMDCFINLSVVTRDIAWFFSFLFPLCNKTTTVKTVLSEDKPSGWSRCFPVRNFCATGRYSRCSCVVVPETNVKMHSKCYCKIDIFSLLTLLIPSAPFWKIVLKFDKHGLRQIDRSWVFSLLNITTPLLCFYLYLYLKLLHLYYVFIFTYIWKNNGSIICI